MTQCRFFSRVAAIVALVLPTLAAGPPGAGPEQDAAGARSLAETVLNESAHHRDRNQALDDLASLPADETDELLLRVALEAPASFATKAASILIQRGHVEHADPLADVVVNGGDWMKIRAADAIRSRLTHRQEWNVIPRRLLKTALADGSISERMDESTSSLHWIESAAWALSRSESPDDATLIARTLRRAPDSHWLWFARAAAADTLPLSEQERDIAGSTWCDEHRPHLVRIGAAAALCGRTEPAREFLEDSIRARLREFADQPIGDFALNPWGPEPTDEFRKRRNRLKETVGQFRFLYFAECERFAIDLLTEASLARNAAIREAASYYLALREPQRFLSLDTEFADERSHWQTLVLIAASYPEHSGEIRRRVPDDFYEFWRNAINRVDGVFGGMGIWGGMFGG